MMRNFSAFLLGVVIVCCLLAFGAEQAAGPVVMLGAGSMRPSGGEEDWDNNETRAEFRERMDQERRKRNSDIAYVTMGLLVGAVVVLLNLPA